MKLVIVSSSSGDWEGLYKDGKLLTEGHSLRTDEVLSLLGFDVEQKEAKEDWLEDIGSLPANLDEVEF